MLTKTFEWYRIVHPEPDDDIIRKRTASVSQMAIELAKPENALLLPSLCNAITNGLQSDYTDDSNVVRLTLTSIRDNQPAFAYDLASSKLEIRVCCGLAVGEILYQSTIAKEQSMWAQASASLLISGLGMRQRLPQKYLQEMLDEIHKLARTVIESAARNMRMRACPDFSVLDFTEDQVDEIFNQEEAEDESDDPYDIARSRVLTFWERSKSGIIDLIVSLNRQSQNDREELEVLWWMYNGISESSNTPLARLRPAQAALYCGVEISNKVTHPAPSSTHHMLSASVEKAGKPTGHGQRSIADTVAEWSENDYDLIQTKGGIYDAVRAFPTLFPLTWLCMRLRESNGLAVWEAEFNAKSGLKASDKHTPTEVSIQIFRELGAQELLAKIVGP